MPHNHSKLRSKYPAPFSLRLSREERSELKKLACGKPLGEFIRDAIFNKGIRSSTRKPTLADKKLLAKLLGALGKSRISSNINQLARAANSGSLPVNEEILKSLFEAVRSIEWMRKSLIKGMGIKPQGRDRDSPNDP